MVFIEQKITCPFLARCEGRNTQMSAVLENNMKSKNTHGGREKRGKIVCVERERERE